MGKEHKGLPASAYEVMDGNKYEPYVPKDKEIPEFTPLSVILGILQAVIFGVAMVYVGLKIGMTISASVPAAVISMGILKGVFKRGTILENNLVQTIASAGESLAAGVIFTIPAAFLWPEFNPSTFTLLRLFLIAFIGGVLGVLLMIPLRRFLIVEEHGKLKYPEGTACAEVLVAGDVGGNPAKTVFGGIVVGAIFKFLQQALKLWKGVVSWNIPGVKNLVFAGESSSILLGVGYIIGLEVSSLMLAGGLLAWFVLIPLISYFGENLHTAVAPATTLIKDMSADAIWDSYIRYIGAGAVAFGGLISLAKSMPTIWQSFKSAMGQFKEVIKNKGQALKEVPRTQRDLPLGLIIGISVALIILIVLTKNISSNFFHGVIGAILVFIFGFFFVTVSSRIVGLVGSSSNPVSGMTIGTLIASCLIFKALGFTGIDGMVTALVVGAFVCIAMCMAGDISQDLKTGFLLGATPLRQQIGQIIGVAASSLFVVMTVLYFRNNIAPPPGFHGEVFKAPQANLMAILIRGIMEGKLPWILIITGGFIAVCVELLGAPALPFAVGLYLPLELSTPVMIGGILAYITKKVFKDPKVYKVKSEKGILASSGLIAGDALMGILIIALSAKGIDLAKGWENAPFVNWQWPAVLAFFLLAWYLWQVISKKDPEEAIIEEIEEEKTTEKDLKDL